MSSSDGSGTGNPSFGYPNPSLVCKYVCMYFISAAKIMAVLFLLYQIKVMVIVVGGRSTVGEVELIWLFWEIP